MSRNFCRYAVLLVLLSALAAAPTVALAAETGVSFPLLYLNGSAALSGNVLRLTPSQGNLSASAFTPWTMKLAPGGAYSTSFAFSTYGSGGIGPADGIAFVLQPGTRTALSQGGGLGYSGIPNSVGVEFDTWYNSYNADPNDNHIGVDLGGSVVSTVTATPPWRMALAPVNYVWIDYAAAPSHRMEVRIATTTVRPVTPSLVCTIDIAATCGTNKVFAGFTAATGSGCQVHDILYWRLGGGLSASARVLTPVAPATMKRAKRYSIYGYVEPEHTVGTSLVTLQFYRRNSRGAYVYHHSVSATRYGYSTTRTRYGVKTSLSRTGRWRVRAMHSCSLHTVSYSGFDYIRVK